MPVGPIFVIGSETIKKPQKSGRRRSIIREFCLNTSAHGVPAIARSQSIHNKLFWLICFTAFFETAMYFIVREIFSYFDYPTQTSVDIISEWPQYFPAFTVCNVAPVRTIVSLDRF